MSNEKLNSEKLNIFPSHHHTTSAHPTSPPCIAAKLLSPQTYYPIRQITIFHQNSVVCPIRLNRTVKPHILIYSAFLDIDTTHSTCRVNGNISNG